MTAPDDPIGRQLDTFRRCRFVERTFAPYPALADTGPDGGTGWVPYRGQVFDPVRWELVPGGWDHEHCDVCSATIDPGDRYWANADPAGGHVDLCPDCYPRVMAALGRG